MFVTTVDRKACLRYFRVEGGWIGIEDSLSLLVGYGFGVEIFVAFFSYSNLLYDIVYFFKFYTKKLGSSAIRSNLSKLSSISPLAATSVAITLYFASGTISPLPNLLNSQKVTELLSADNIIIISLTSSLVNSSLIQSNTNTKSSSVIVLSLLISIMLNALNIYYYEKVSLLRQYPVYLLLCSVWGWTTRGMGYQTSCWMGWGIGAWIIATGWIFEYDQFILLFSGALIFIWQSKCRC